MLLVLAIILFLGWIFGFLVFHVTLWAIHILLVIAVIALIFHFIRRA